MSTQTTYHLPGDRAALDAFRASLSALPDWRTLDYWQALKPPPARSWPAADPLPEVTTFDPLDAISPGSVEALILDGRLAGWPVKAGFSRGEVRTPTIGRYKLVETWGVWSGVHGPWRWNAMYERTIGARGGWTWSRTAIWRPGYRFTLANVTDLREFLAVGGTVSRAWFKGIEARVHDQKARAKARPATSKPKEGQS